jgi:phage regulator Rha-like protein
MEAVIKSTENGLLKFSNLTAVAGNTLAEMMDIKHKNLMRTIEKVKKYEENRKKQGSHLSLVIVHIEEEKDHNFNAIFKEWEFTNKMGRTYKTFIMNEDALYLVIANLQGQKAHDIKVQFKAEFNNMKREIRVREISKNDHERYTDSIKLLRAKLKEVGSRSEPFLYSTIQKKIHKQATGRSMPKGGIDHDTLSTKEGAVMDLLRQLVPVWIQESSMLPARDSKNYVYDQIKSFKVRKITIPDSI